MEELFDGQNQIGFFDSSKNIADFGESWEHINFKMKQTLQIIHQRPSLGNQKLHGKKQQKKQSSSINKLIPQTKQPKYKQKQNNIQIKQKNKQLEIHNSSLRVVAEEIQNIPSQLTCKATNSSHCPIQCRKIISTTSPVKTPLRFGDKSCDTQSHKQRSLSKNSLRVHSKGKLQQRFNQHIYPNNFQPTNSFHVTIVKLPNIIKKQDQTVLNVSRQLKIRSQFFRSQVNQIQKEDNPSKLFLNCSKTYSSSSKLYPSLTIHHSPKISLNQLMGRFPRIGSKQRAQSLSNLHEKHRIHLSITGLKAQQSHKAKVGINNKQNKHQIKLSVAPVVTKLKIIRNKNQ